MPLATAEARTVRLSDPAPAGLGEYRSWATVVSLTVLSFVYFASTSVHAAREKLWYDEIWTLDAATLFPPFHALWSYLKQGLELNPPLGFILSAVSEGIFGRNEFGVRFPSIVAFWIMAGCLYVYLGRRLPRSFAMAAALLTVLTAAGRYSYEARPYALAMAFGGIALVAWQAAAEGRARRVALVVLAASLALALCSLTFAVTLALPFLAGEVVRTVRRKRVDWPVWCAFAAAAPAVLILWSLKTAGNAASYNRFDGTVPWHILNTYLQMLRPAAAPLGLAFLLTVVLRGQGPSTAERQEGLRAHELAALVGFALIPFAAVPLSTLAGRYFLRYSLNCTVGLAGLLAVILFYLGGRNRFSGTTILVIFAIPFLIGQFYKGDRRQDAGLKAVNTSEEIQDLLEKMPSDAPIAICYTTTFIELEHYSSPQLAARLYYLTDPVGAAAIDGDLLPEVKTPLIARFFPFRAHFEDYDKFVGKHKRFYVVQPIRTIAREYFAGRLSMKVRELPDHRQFFEAKVL